MLTNPATISVLEKMRRCLPRAAVLLNIDLGPDCAHWINTLDRKILPRLDPDFPLVVAICGGGSTGKSTLFNTLVGKPVSPTGGRAGLNRRVLIAVAEHGHGSKNLLNQWPEAFDGPPAALERQEAASGGRKPAFLPQCRHSRQFGPAGHPDIDTGAQGSYANRDLARQSLEVADLFIYIFTNATYNNLDNTDFITRMLTGMGTRPCYLVYRVYPSFSDTDVQEHADVVAGNIYGPGKDSNILGIYRADEDNAVAAGQAPMALRPVAGANQPLVAALTTLDTAALRHRLLGSMVKDAVDQGHQMTETISRPNLNWTNMSRHWKMPKGQSVQLALSHFPSDRVLRRFAQIWLESDPTHIKLMRRTGTVIQWPMKTIIKTVRYFKETEAPAKPPPSEDEQARQVEMDLLNAANRLYHDCVNDRLSMGTRQINAPAAAVGDRDVLRQQPWESTLEIILSQKEKVLSWSAQLDEDLKKLADELRSRMGLMDQFRQTFAALLNVIPATAAVTYILHTGDPVGAAGIKVKLTGLFGLHDLYALIAIPATAGMSRADRGQLEQLLAPLARTWLEHKSKAVQSLFEHHITGAIFSRLSAIQEQTDILLKEIGNNQSPSTAP